MAERFPSGQKGSAPFGQGRRQLWLRGAGSSPERIIIITQTSCFSGSPETGSFQVHGQDMERVGKPVQEGPSELFTAEHLRPLGKLQVGGNDQGLPIVALNHHLEE